MGGSPSSITQTTLKQVPEWLQPWATGFMTTAGANIVPGLASTIPGAGQFVNQSPFTPYPFPNKQIAPLTDLQLQGIRGVGAKGTTSPNIEAALAALSKMIGQPDIINNPLLSTMFNQGMGWQSRTMSDPNVVSSPELARDFSQAMGLGWNVMGQNAINNPLLARYYTAAADPMMRYFEQTTMPGINAGALKAGAFGSSGHQQLIAEQQRILGESLDKLATGIYTPAWQEQERLRQSYAQMVPEFQRSRLAQEELAGRAAGMLPSYMQAGLTQEEVAQRAAQMTPEMVARSYFPSEMLMQAGTMEQNQAQQILNMAYQNLFNMAGWPFQAQDIFANALRIAMGTGAVETQQLPTAGPFGPFRF